MKLDKYQIVTALDDSTCEKCGSLDQQVFLESERQEGVNSPPFHHGCRCTTVPYFADMDDWGATRAARNFEGKHQEVPGNITYKQWKKEYYNQPVQTDNIKYRR